MAGRRYGIWFCASFIAAVEGRESFTTEWRAEERTKSLERRFGVTSSRGLSGTKADVAGIPHAALDDHVMTAGLSESTAATLYFNLVQHEVFIIYSESEEGSQQDEESQGEDTSVSASGSLRSRTSPRRFQTRIRQVLSAACVIDDSHQRQLVPATTIGGTGGTPIRVPDPWCADTRPWVRADTGSIQRDVDHVQHLEDDGVSDYSESDLSQDYGADYGEQWFDGVNTPSATHSPVQTLSHQSLPAASSHEPMAP